MHYLSLLSVLLLWVPLFVFAQSNDTSFVPLANYGSGNLISNTLSQSGSLGSYFNSLFKIALSVGAIAAVLRIAYAGYMYMGAADMWGNKQKAREILGNAIVGLILLLAIYLILGQIDPRILNLQILNGNSLQVDTTGAQPATQTGDSASAQGLNSGDPQQVQQGSN